MITLPIIRQNSRDRFGVSTCACRTFTEPDWTRLSCPPIRKCDRSGCLHWRNPLAWGHLCQLRSESLDHDRQSAYSRRRHSGLSCHRQAPWSIYIYAGGPKSRGVLHDSRNQTLDATPASCLLTCVSGKLANQLGYAGKYCSGAGQRLCGSPTGPAPIVVSKIPRNLILLPCTLGHIGFPGATSSITASVPVLHCH